MGTRLAREKECEAQERAWQIERERYELQGNGQILNPSMTNRVDLKDIKSLLPTMTDIDILSFFMSYERVMLSKEVHQDLWARYLLAQMLSRALKVFARLSIEASREYDVVKHRILEADKLNAQKYLHTTVCVKRDKARTKCCLLTCVRFCIAF